MKSITEQLHKVIDEFEEDINRDSKATLIFKIKDWKFDKFIKSYSNQQTFIWIKILSFKIQKYCKKMKYYE